jgi:hypothetical protein
MLANRNGISIAKSETGQSRDHLVSLNKQVVRPRADGPVCAVSSNPFAIPLSAPPCGCRILRPRL